MPSVPAPGGDPSEDLCPGRVRVSSPPLPRIGRRLCVAAAAEVIRVFWTPSEEACAALGASPAAWERTEAHPGCASPPYRLTHNHGFCDMTQVALWVSQAWDPGGQFNRPASPRRTHTAVPSPPQTNNTLSGWLARRSGHTGMPDALEIIIDRAQHLMHRRIHNLLNPDQRRLVIDVLRRWAAGSNAPGGAWAPLPPTPVPCTSFLWVRYPKAFTAVLGEALAEVMLNGPRSPCLPGTQSWSPGCSPPRRTDRRCQCCTTCLECRLEHGRHRPGTIGLCHAPLPGLFGLDLVGCAGHSIACPGLSGERS